jgi:NAD(P)-dependent dehydrogenase (short-subunit alcohol dehydrogenase family)
MSLDGKAAFVTGASRGIGAAVARSLSAAGVSVGLASRSGADLGLERSIGLPCDVRDPAAVDAAVAATVERFGRLDILVANAGVGAYGPFLDLSPKHLEEMIDVNLKGTIYAVRAALPHLLESAKAGSAAGKAGGARPVNGGATGASGADIVTLASEAGRRGLPYEAVYCASKFGQVGFTRALDHELRESGVRCTNVCPGGVATDFALDDGRGRTPDALPGMMSAEDVAEVVMFVLTRPHTHRILEAALRPMTETSWG